MELPRGLSNGLAREALVTGGGLRHDPKAPGHQAGGRSTGLSLENIPLETQGMREKGT